MMNHSFDLKDLEITCMFHYYVVQRTNGKTNFFVSLEGLKQDEIDKAVESEKNDIVSVKEISYWEYLSQLDTKIEAC